MISQKVVFVGYNPSRLAWKTGFHYANPAIASITCSTMPA